MGHKVHQECSSSMDMDNRMQRASFIKNTCDIRSMFSFALPQQVLSAISVYSSHFYREKVGQGYRSWNTCSKLVWDIPRSMLAKDFCSVRENC